MLFWWITVAQHNTNFKLSYVFCVSHIWNTYAPKLHESLPFVVILLILHRFSSKLFLGSFATHANWNLTNFEGAYGAFGLKLLQITVFNVFLVTIQTC